MKYHLHLKPIVLLTITALAFVTIAVPLPIHQLAVAAIPPMINITSPVEGQALNTTSVSILGSTETTVTVDVYIDDVWQGSTVPDSSGNWTFNAVSVGEGTHSLYATATDSGGNVGISNRVNFQVDVTAPELTITKPVNGSYVNLPLIEGRTEPETDVTVFVYGKQATVRSDLLGNWFYFDQTLPEGQHTVYATAVDKAGNVTTAPNCSFILDTTRPVILPDFSPPEDMTQVPLDVLARVYLVEKYPMDAETMRTAISLAEVGGTTGETVYGTVYSAVYTTVYGDPYYEIIFQPNALLRPYTKYRVSVNPLLKDAAGNPVYPRVWEFQTTGATVYENPHGNYTLNVNTCVNCHRPHRAQDPKLSRPIDAQAPIIDDYCNACHDGTAAPLPQNWPAANNHNFRMSIEGTAGPSACAGCHNPHLTLTEENPDLLMDYYYYEHNDPTNPYLPNSTEEALCENCHLSTIKDDPRVTYVMYNYRKWHTSKGTPEDYSLCLRCHDGSNASDIATYYKQPSRHTIKAEDGSYLNGHLACSDCHNTHGSSNLKMLREKLGHNKGRQFLSQGDTWDPANERRFCTSCHNNETELYGIVAGFVYDIPGHAATDTQYCSSCHGGSPVAAAHGPQ
ncbi:putative multiheme cytochrome c [Thermincola ferriacetica]|uniref:Putative multiheme cytochrome c n=1 Tax=Thermincola ferriacetica TaxID=281456 RepID=A0A0L6W610_9FIRM|nr:Ig-like domain-containing protein [Thermincola ferriacetica]KNZ70539.1 putative multiheme cytochrome c [Thermincola ferriacetica]